METEDLTCNRPSSSSGGCGDRIFVYQQWSQNNAASQLNARVPSKRPCERGAEEAGKVKESGDEGATVKTGDALIHLDDTLLQAQKEQAVAALNVLRRALLRRALASARTITTDDATSLKTATPDQSVVTNRPSDFNVPLWYFTHRNRRQPRRRSGCGAESPDHAQNNLTSIETSARERLCSVETPCQYGSQLYVQRLNNRVQNYRTSITGRYPLYMLINRKKRLCKQNSPDF